MKKFLLTTLISLALILTLTVIVNAGTYGDLTYSVSNGKVTITDCNTSATSVIIPVTINGCPVTSIGIDAFYNCTSLTSITIPNGVTSIGDKAFRNCKSLASVTIPSSVTSIGEYAFYNCESLTSVTIPSSVTSIEYGTFYDCERLTSVTFESGSKCTSIGEKAFLNCYSLKTVVIGDSVKQLGWGAFYLCKNLTSITIPQSVTSIGDYAFYLTGSFTIFGIKGSYAETYANNCDIPFVAFVTLDSITVTPPTKTTYYTSNTHFYLTGLKVVANYSDGSKVDVTNRATLSAVNFSKVGKQTITVTYEGKSANFTIYVNAVTLDSITVTPPTKTDYFTLNTSLDLDGFKVIANYNDGSMIDVTDKATVSNVDFSNVGEQSVIVTYEGKSVTFEVSVTEKNLENIASGLIKNTEISWVIDCDGILTISGEGDIPDYSASVRSPWYNYRTQITSVIVEKGIISVGAQAFAFLENVTSIDLAESVKSVGATFMRGTKASKIDLSYVEVMMENALAASTNLENVIFSESFKDARGNVFGSNNVSITVTAPVNSYAHKYTELYKTKFAGKANASFVSNGSEATNPVLVFGSMGEKVFYSIYKESDTRNVMVISGKGAVRSYWYISDARKAMDAEQGGNNFAPTYYMYEDTKFGRPILRNTKKLQVLEGITEIGNYSFYRCLKAQEVEILGPITRIGNAAFQACEAIRKIELPSTVTAIGKNAFNGCRYLKTMTIPDSVESIGETIFKNADLEPNETRPSESAKLTITTTNQLFIDYINTYYPTDTCKVILK